MQIDNQKFSVGAQVRVIESVVVYHHPEHRNEGLDLNGQQGEVVEVVKAWQGRPVSANFPFLVKFGPKFKVHFQAHELEAV